MQHTSITSNRYKMALLGMVLFLFILFLLTPYLCLCIDRCINLHSPLPSPWNLIGVVIFTLGGVLSLWCVLLFFCHGKGTPAPIAPPKRLVTMGPYRYTRNPMVAGLFSMLVGLGLLLNSLSLFLSLSSVYSFPLVLYSSTATKKET